MLKRVHDPKPLDKRVKILSINAFTCFFMIYTLDLIGSSL